MQIQNNVNLSLTKPNNIPTFKAVYPVHHWVAESNGSYAPVVSIELTKKLQRIIVGMLNHSKKIPTNVSQKANIYISKCDLDYRRMSIVRSFYNKFGGYNKKDNVFRPFSYLITGYDAENFDNEYGRSIGIARRNAPVKQGTSNSAELKQTIQDYTYGGLNYIKDKSKKLYDSEGIEYSLHTKFETVRSKTGRLKGYKLIDLKFCPNEGPNNPFVRTGYINSKNSLE